MFFDYHFTLSGRANLLTISFSLSDLARIFFMQKLVFIEPAESCPQIESHVKMKPVYDIRETESWLDFGVDTKKEDIGGGKAAVFSSWYT